MLGKSAVQQKVGGRALRMFRSIRDQVRQQFLGFIALALVVSGGTAYAATVMIEGKNVRNNSLTGADIDEKTLGPVRYSLAAGLARSAPLGGMGRSSDPRVRDSCNPADTSVNCAYVTLKLPAPARVLVIGSIRGTSSLPYGEFGARAFGACAIGTSRSGGRISESTSLVHKDESVSIAYVTQVFPAGTIHLGIDCLDGNVDMSFNEAKVAAVALSAE